MVQIIIHSARAAPCILHYPLKIESQNYGKWFTIFVLSCLALQINIFYCFHLATFLP